MNGLVKLRLIRPAAAKPAADLEPRCTHALELLLASRGNPSLEVENALAIDPHSSCMGSSRSPPLGVKRPSRRLSLRFAGRWFCGLAGRLEDTLMQPLCEALRAFAAGDYEAYVERPGHVRDVSHNCGESLAQCCLVQPTYIEAARALLAERMAQNQRTQLEDAPTNF